MDSYSCSLSVAHVLQRAQSIRLQIIFWGRKCSTQVVDDWKLRRFSSVVEQLIRNERVNGSNPLSGSPLSQKDYL
jgi:hypothetical protein